MIERRRRIEQTGVKNQFWDRPSLENSFYFCLSFSPPQLNKFLILVFSSIFFRYWNRVISITFFRNFIFLFRFVFVLFAQYKEHYYSHIRIFQRNKDFSRLDWIWNQRSSITCSRCWWLGTRVWARAVSSSASLPKPSKTFLLPLVIIVSEKLISCFIKMLMKKKIHLALLVNSFPLMINCEFEWKIACILIWGCFLGVDFKVKFVDIGGKKLKLAIWDTGNLLKSCLPCFVIHPQMWILWSCCLWYDHMVLIVCFDFHGSLVQFLGFGWIKS